MLLLRLAAIATLATSVLAATASRAEGRSFNPPTSILVNRQEPTEASTNSVAHVLRNGERLAAGIPLMKPRFGTHLPGQRQSAPTRVTAAKRCAASPTSNSGYIKAVLDDGSNTIVGFVRTTGNSFGEYGLTRDSAQYLTVSFTTTCGTNDHLDITRVDATPVAYPFFGGVVGFSSGCEDLAPGSANYAYIAETGRTPRNSPPANPGNAFTANTKIPKQSESAIWTYDPSSGALKPQWINADSSQPSTIIAYTQDVLSLTGDFTSFQNAYGPSQQLKLFFVPA